MSDNEANGWEIRNVNYGLIHGDNREAYQTLLKSLGLRERMVVGDFMSSYGEVGEKVLEYCELIKINIHLVLLDQYFGQLKKSLKLLAPSERKGNLVSRVINDIRYASFKKSSFDRIIIKYGVHEIPKSDQPKVLENCRSFLKPNGELYVWDSMGNDEELNYFFNLVVREKDRLSGFDSLVKNRYFPTAKEIQDNMALAGLSSHEIYSGLFEYKTDRFLPDLKTNEKLQEWNDFLRKNLPDKIKKLIQFTDNGLSITMQFTKKIFKGNTKKITHYPNRQPINFLT